MENSYFDIRGFADQARERIKDLEESNRALTEENIKLKIENSNLRDRIFKDERTDVRSVEYLNSIIVPKLDLELEEYNLKTPDQKENAIRHLVIVIDMNGLKIINDTYGYDAGNDALVSVAESLKQGLRVNDELVRMTSSAGDEFLLIAPLPPGTIIDEAEFSITQRIKDVVLARSNGELSVSVGCTTLEKHNTFTEAQTSAVKAMQNDKDAYYEYKKINRVGRLALAEMSTQDLNRS